MVASVFIDFIGRVKEASPEELIDRLDELGYEMFEVLPTIYEGAYLKSAISYILYAYSADSDKVLLEGNWSDNKEKIAERVQLPDTLISDLVHLKSKECRDVIIKYLNKQGDADFQQYQYIRDLHLKIKDKSFSDLYNEAGEFDQDKSLKNKDELSEIYEEKCKLEEKIRKKHMHIFDGYKDVNKSGGTEFSLSLEQSPIIKRQKGT